ncbi:MAG: hypothetical protein ACRERC_25080 [Candidatus Binatia bacterium]
MTIDVASMLVDVPDSRLAPSNDDIGPVVVGGESLHIPSRVYFPVPDERALARHSDSGRVLLGCIYTRHHDGHVREKFLAEIISSPLNWVPPFVIQLLGEYVIEIHRLILCSAGYLGQATYTQFVAENPQFIRLTRQRAASYWDCYYRGALRTLDDYPATQALDRIVAQHAAQLAVAADGASRRR